VQRRLYFYLSNQFIGDAQIYNSIRRVSSVIQMMHTLMFYYWVTNPMNRSGITPKGVGMYAAGSRSKERQIERAT